MNRYDWRPARVTQSTRATGKMITLELEPNEWIPHLPGQHYELRFPGEEVSRKFSISSAPERDRRLEFGIEVLPYGLLSPMLAQCDVGDILEVRGPTGAGFTWNSAEPGPIVLLGAGSGVTPLLSMEEHHRLSGKEAPLFMLLSAREPGDLYGLRRLPANAVIRWTAREPRIDTSFLAQQLAPALDNPSTTARVCGPRGFMETMVDSLLDLGLSEERVRSEGFV